MNGFDEKTGMITVKPDTEGLGKARIKALCEWILGFDRNLEMNKYKFYLKLHKKDLLHESHYPDFYSLFKKYATNDDLELSETIARTAMVALEV